MTNKEIAKKIGISEAAVSLAKNHHSGVSEETRERVLRLLKSEGAGRKKGGVILMSVHKNNKKILDSKPFFEELIRTIQTEALKYSKTLILSHFKEGMNLNEYFAYIKGLNCDGIIVLATELEESDVENYKRLKRPMVILDSAMVLQDVDVIFLDAQNDFVKMMRYAYHMGHRRFGYLMSSVRTSNYDQHWLGFSAEAYKYGIPQKNIVTIEMPGNMKEPYLKMKQVLKDKNKTFQKPICFLADQDYIAIGAMQAVKEVGFLVPEEVSFIGYDDISACEACNPGLTSVHVNNAEMGRLAVKRLVEKIENKDQIALRIAVPSLIVERSSVSRIEEA